MISGKRMLTVERLKPGDSLVCSRVSHCRSIILDRFCVGETII